MPIVQEKFLLCLKETREKKLWRKCNLIYPSQASKQLFCLVSALIPPENMCADIRYVSIYSEIGTSIKLY